MSWTDERVELLSRLWLEGRSASQIATALGGGLTRNAVIGKVHRLGLAGRVKPNAAPPTGAPEGEESQSDAGIDLWSKPPRRAAPRRDPGGSRNADDDVCGGQRAERARQHRARAGRCACRKPQSPRGRRRMSWWRCRSG